MYSKIGISNIKDHSPDNDLPYPGDNTLRLLYARAKWKTDGRDDSKNLAFDLKYKPIEEIPFGFPMPNLEIFSSFSFSFSLFNDQGLHYAIHIYITF